MSNCGTCKTALESAGISGTRFTLASGMLDHRVGRWVNSIIDNGMDHLLGCNHKEWSQISEQLIIASEVLNE